MLVKPQERWNLSSYHHFNFAVNLIEYFTPRRGLFSIVAVVVVHTLQRHFLAAPRWDVVILFACFLRTFLQFLQVPLGFPVSGSKYVFRSHVHYLTRGVWGQYWGCSRCSHSVSWWYRDRQSMQRGWRAGFWSPREWSIQDWNSYQSSLCLRLFELWYEGIVE